MMQPALGSDSQTPVSAEQPELFAATRAAAAPAQPVEPRDDPKRGARIREADRSQIRWADGARVIVGVEVTNRGSDMGQTSSMLDQIESRTGKRPIEHLVDGGYRSHPAIEAAAERGVKLYAPVPKPRKGDTRDPHLPREEDSEAVAAWRVRMGTEEAKEIDKQRGATAETVNAEAKHHRGLDHLPVRGLTKALGSACLFALTSNMLRMISLGAGR
jgi:hypothetical protein